MLKPQIPTTALAPPAASAAPLVSVIQAMAALIMATLIMATVIMASWNTAQAQAPRVPCEVRSKLVERLAATYKESSVATGLAHDGKLVEVLTNASGETWSIIVTSPQGLSCLVATGEDWRKFESLMAEPKV